MADELEAGLTGFEVDDQVDHRGQLEHRGQHARPA